jgi:hypothetical protein
MTGYRRTRDIVQMHKTVHAERQERYEEKEHFDELLF